DTVQGERATGAFSRQPRYSPGQQPDNRTGDSRSGCEYTSSHVPLGLAAAPLNGTEGGTALPKGQERRDGEIKVTCPICGHENRNTISWARGRSKMRCAGCRSTFYFRKTKVRKALDKALDAVMEAWRRF